MRNGKPSVLPRSSAPSQIGTLDSSACGPYSLCPGVEYQNSCRGHTSPFPHCLLGLVGGSRRKCVWSSLYTGKFIRMAGVGAWWSLVHSALPSPSAPQVIPALPTLLTPVPRKCCLPPPARPSLPEIIRAVVLMWTDSEAVSLRSLSLPSSFSCSGGRENLLSAAFERRISQCPSDFLPRTVRGSASFPESAKFIFCQLATHGQIAAL